MPAQKYSVNQHPIQALLTYIGSGGIAIPEIQRAMATPTIPNAFNGCGSAGETQSFCGDMV